MRVKSINGTEAIVELGGLTKAISVMLVPDVRPGDYVIVHAGFAIETLDTKAALETIDYLNRLCGDESGMRQRDDNTTG